MAGGKSWGKKKDPQPEKPGEETAAQGQGPGDIDTGYPEAVSGNIEAEKALDELRAGDDATPSCMNGCPHFFAVRQDGAKYLGLCRRFPPVPLANARWFSSHTVINHPVKGFPKHPICGEHPIFQQGQVTRQNKINLDLAIG